MDKSNLFSIGEFAQLAGVTTKALRYYEKKSILKPTWIEPDTGYRYYSIYQINQLELIGIFTDLDICLNQFGNYVEKGFRSVDYQKLLQSAKSLTQERIQTLETKMRYIDFLKQKAENPTQESHVTSQPLWLLPCNEKPIKSNIEKQSKKYPTLFLLMD